MFHFCPIKYHIFIKERQSCDIKLVNIIICPLAIAWMFLTKEKHQFWYTICCAVTLPRFKSKAVKTKNTSTSTHKKQDSYIHKRKREESFTKKIGRLQQWHRDSLSRKNLYCLDYLKLFHQENSNISWNLYVADWNSLI